MSIETRAIAVFDSRDRVNPLQHRAAFVGLLVTVLAGSFYPIAAQQPEPRSEERKEKEASEKKSSQEKEAPKEASFVPEIEEAWSKLRAQVGSLEFTAPDDAITRYRRFYEQRGAESDLTAIKISNVIAQIYWQRLGNRAKALEVYDQAVQKYGELPQGKFLQQERDFVAGQEAFQPVTAAAPITVQGMTQSTVVIAPIELQVAAPEVPAATELTPVTISTFQAAVVAPEAVLPKGVVPPAVPAGGIVIPQLPLVVIAPSPSVSSSPPESRSLAAPINARMAVLRGFLAQWRSGRMSWEQLVAEAKLSPDDVKMLASTPHIVSFHSEGALIREKLGETIQSFPELVQNRATLPVPAQVALAEAYTKAKNPLAEEIYLELLKQEIPVNAWWTKELLLVRLAKHYGVLGNPIKAGEISLQIAETTSDEAWAGNSLVDAARYYTQAGEAEKAQELYQRAQKSTYGWAQGVALYDQASALIAQDKHNEARQLLSTPLEGRYAEQIKVGLLSLLARSYNMTGETDKAKQFAAQAVSQAKAVKLLANEGLEFQMESAQSTLEWSERWEKTPIVVEAGELSSSAVVGTQRLKRRLIVRTQRKVSLVIGSNHPQVNAQVVGEGRRAPTGLYYEQDVLVEVQLSAEDRDLNAVLTVSSPDIPGFKATAPLRALITAETNSETKSETKSETNEPKAAQAQTPQAAAGQAETEKQAGK